jgi:phage terminase large subunit-like protein
VPEGVTLSDFAIFADPSALRGADWFAMVLSAKGSDGCVYILDTFSRNEGTKELMARKIRQWCGEWDVHDNIYIETNGIIGLDFYDFCNNSDLPIRGWNSKGKKFDRILANFENITNIVYFVNNDELTPFLEQVYEFNERCEHDDNIDAVSSSVSLQLHYL